MAWVKAGNIRVACRSETCFSLALCARKDKNLGNS